MPRRDDSLLVSRFGSRTASELLSVIQSLKNDFYASDAKWNAANLDEMERMAIADFRLKHPEVADDIVEALAWCYTFDFR